MEQENIKNKFERFHDRHYKLILLIPLTLMIISLSYIFIFYSKNGDIIYKDISLTGGTVVTIYDNIDAEKVAQDLQGKLEDISTREIYDLLTGEQKAIEVKTKSDGEITKKVIEDYLGYELNSQNSSIEFTGPALSENFYNQLLVAILFAFILMAIVVFIIFRTFIPSMAVIISAFADIVMTLALVDFLGLKISSAGIVAFLMLIGYSVDTDILLTSRVLKRKTDSLNSRLFKSFKTGMTMTLTSLLAVVAALIIVNPFSSTLGQIFIIISIGLLFDMINTWITNISILKWYAENKLK